MIALAVTMRRFRSFLFLVSLLLAIGDGGAAADSDHVAEVPATTSGGRGAPSMRELVEAKRTASDLDSALHRVFQLFLVPEQNVPVAGTAASAGMMATRQQQDEVDTSFHGERVLKGSSKSSKSRSSSHSKSQKGGKGQWQPQPQPQHHTALPPPPPSVTSPTTSSTTGNTMVPDRHNGYYASHPSNGKGGKESKSKKGDSKSAKAMPPPSHSPPHTGLPSPPTSITGTCQAELDQCKAKLAEPRDLFVQQADNCVLRREKDYDDASSSNGTKYLLSSNLYDDDTYLFSDRPLRHASTMATTEVRSVSTIHNYVSFCVTARLNYSIPFSSATARV